MTATSRSTVGAWTGEGLAHEAFIFDDDEAMRARVIPYIEEGRVQGQPSIVVASEGVCTLLADRLGEDRSDLVLFQDSERFWEGGSQTLAPCQERMTPLLEAGGPWRLVCQPTWLTREGGEVWSRFEAVANDAFADYPYYSLCLHDRRQLSRELVEDALRTHPLMWDGDDVVRSPAYQPTAAFLRSVEPPWTERPEGRDAEVVTRPGAARAFVHRLLPGHLPEDHIEDVVLAVHELVANALNAAGAAEVSHWHADGSHVWEVRDDGTGMHDTAAGYAPPRRDVPSGRGLWIARSLADEATVRPYGPGTAIRLYFREHD